MDQIVPNTGSLNLSGVGAVILYGSILLTGQTPSVVQGTVLTPSTGALVCTGVAPSTGQGAIPSTGTLTLTGQQAGLPSTTSITPSSGSLVFGYRQGITPSTGTLTLAGTSPTLSESGSSQAITPTSGSLVLTGLQPLQDAVRLTPSTGSLKCMQWALVEWNANTDPDLAGYFVYHGTDGVTFTQSRNVSAPFTSYVWEGLPYGLNYFRITAYDTSDNESAPTSPVNIFISGGGWAPTLHLGITPLTQSLTLAGSSPTVVSSTSGNEDRVPATGSLNATGQTPLVGGDYTVTPSVGTLTLTGVAPTVSQSGSQQNNPLTGTLALTGVAPTIGMAVEPSTGSLTLTGRQPDVTGPNVEDPRTGILLLSGYAPTLVVAGPDLPITPSTGTLTFSHGIQSPYPCLGNWGESLWGYVNWCADRGIHYYTTDQLDRAIYYLSTEIVYTGSSDFVVAAITPILNINAQLPDRYQTAAGEYEFERLSVEVLYTGSGDFVINTIRPNINLRTKWRGST